jgi:uncharacterized protein YhbP (UPF0306 family)
MSTDLQDKVLNYLQGHNVMTLATHGEDGVWAASVFYVNDGFSLYFLSAASTRHARDLAARAEVAATIQEDYKSWHEIKGIQLEGRVKLLKGMEKARAIARYGLKYPVVADAITAPGQIATALARVDWYCLEPEHLYFIDNSLGFGHRDLVSLDLAGT